MADNIKITLDNGRLMVTAVVDGLEGLERLILRLKATRPLLEDEPADAQPHGRADHG